MQIVYQPPLQTPWGPIQHKERLASGIWSVSTAGHGGIWLSPGRRSIMLEPWRNFCSRYGDIPNGFYEEDCDWIVPVLAFASELKSDSVEIARKILEADRTSGRNYFAALHHPQRIPVEFNEAECGGAFDGFTVTSDADPGL